MMFHVFSPFLMRMYQAGAIEQISLNDSTCLSAFGKLTRCKRTNFSSSAEQKCQMNSNIFDVANVKQRAYAGGAAMRQAGIMQPVAKHVKASRAVSLIRGFLQ
jgi:hypothetical protein